MYDIAVIGLGPAGLEVVNIAIKHGLKVIAFEKGEIGGASLNLGCIPTKAILKCSNTISEIINCSNLGISLFSAPDYNWQRILDRKTEIVGKFKKVFHSQIEKNITLVRDIAQLYINYDEAQIIAGDKAYQAKNIIVATGSAPAEITSLPFDGRFIVSTDDFYRMQNLPKRVTIIGSGAIALEWAKILSDFKVDVKLIEYAASIAPYLDVELQNRVEKLLVKNEITYFKNDFIKKISNDLVVLNSEVAFETDCILVAIGRTPIIPKTTMSGLGGAYQLKADEYGFTDIDNLYIIGDATGVNMSSHNACYQARVIMNKILYQKPIAKKPIPLVINFSPEIASIGLREQDVRGYDGYKVKKILISSLAKSWCDECPDGIVKVIVFNDKIVGAHVIAKEASSLIAMFSILIDRGVDVHEIQDMIFPYPSYAQSILEVLREE